MPLTNPQIMPAVRANLPAVGEYITTGVSATSTVQVTTSGSLYYLPIDIAAPCNIDALAVNVATAGAGTGPVVRLGLWYDAAGRPGPLLLDAGTSAVTATGDKVLTFTSRRMAPGRYWIGTALQGTITTGPFFTSTTIINQIGLALLTNVSHRSWLQTGVTTVFDANPGTLARSGISPHTCIRVAT